MGHDENTEHDDRYDLDGGQWEALRAQFDTDEGTGEIFGIACNVTTAEHVHALRVGEPGSGLGARVAVMTHGSGGSSTIYVAAPQARRLAAALLNMADEIDGLTPLAFLPRFPEEPEATAYATEEPEEYVEEVETPSVRDLAAALVSLPLNALLRRLS